jgi:serine O-acetyltransferase
MRREAIAAYVSAQANSMFPDESLLSGDDLMPLMPQVFEQIEHCFSRVNNAYFFNGESVLFDHLHADQYAMFLYMLGRNAYLSGADRRIPTKLFLLNKALHAIDAYFEVELPSVFLFVHPLGTVLGRGRYGDYLMVYQRCGVGSNHDNYPELGRLVTLHPGSSVLGRCRVGDNVSLAADSLLLDRDVGPDSVYIGGPRDHLIRRRTEKPAIWRNIELNSHHAG